MIQDLVIQHFAVARVSKTRGRCLVEDDLGMAAGWVQCLERLAGHAFAGQVDQDQARAGAFLGQHNGVRCDIAIGDRDLGARKRGAVEGRFQRIRCWISRAFAGGVAAHYITADDTREDFGLLLIRASQLQRFGEEVDGRGPRNRSEDAAHFFCQHAHFEQAQAEAAMLFRDGRAEPAHFHYLVPDSFIVADIVVIQHQTDGRHGAFGFEEFAGLIAEKFLVFGKVEVHVACAPLCGRSGHSFSSMMSKIARFTCAETRHPTETRKSTFGGKSCR